MKHLDKQTPDGAQLNLDALYKIAPSCFTEAKGEDGEVRRVIDFNKLRLLLGDSAVEDAPEVYDFTWVGKRAAQREAIIVDGNRFKRYKELPHTTIVKGDGKYLSIAAASILAKTYRDDYMNHLAEEYPQYDWLSNKGYPTKKHRDAIKQFGITPYHRKSYNLLGDGQLSFDF